MTRGQASFKELEINTIEMALPMSRSHSCIGDQTLPWRAQRDTINNYTKGTKNYHKVQISNPEPLVSSRVQCVTVDLVRL